MSSYSGILLTLVLLIPVHFSFAQFTYLSPQPQSKMHNRETGIILRTGQDVNETSLRTSLFSISGSLSGNHIVKVKLAADAKGILIQPSVIFSYGETVTVTVADGIRNSDGGTVSGTSFWFKVRQEIHTAVDGSVDIFEDESGDVSGATRTTCDQIPSFIITSTPGAYYDAPLFYWNHVASPATADCWRMTIISSEGDSIFSYHNNAIGFDFKLNDNGYLTCYNKIDSCIDMLDSSYTLVKKLHMGNGYKPNKHECRVYPSGYRFMICYDRQQVDLTPYGGLSNAYVTGLVIQQIDSSDDVVFQWRSWDHFQINDAANDIVLTTAEVDYVHANALEIDFDGNLLLSSRSLDEITKIDLTTGEIIWRMGGKNNEFIFLGNTSVPKPFSHQHHFRRLDSGNYTLFDNGNYQDPEISIAKEFVLDQLNKTATLVWSYSHPPVNGYDVFGSALGSVQVLPNGNRLIDWGQISPNVTFADIPNFTEIDSNKNIVWEFRFDDSSNVAYRACKSPWDRCNLIRDTSLISENVEATSVRLHWNDDTKFSGFMLQYKACSSSQWLSVPLDTNFYLLDALQSNTCYDWRVQTVCEIYNESFYTSAHQFITLNPVAAFEPFDAPAPFTIYPNPATQETTLSFNGNPEGETTVMVYDVMGTELIHNVWFAHQGVNHTKIKFECLTQGIYIVVLKTLQGLQYQQLIIQ